MSTPDFVGPLAAHAVAGNPIYIVEGDGEWQFSDGPADDRGYSEDYSDLVEGMRRFPYATFKFEPLPSTQAASPRKKLTDMERRIAHAINKAYADTDCSPEAHEAVDALRQDIANAVAACGVDYDTFSDLARTKGVWGRR